MSNREEPWWAGLNDCWSQDRTVFLTSGEGLDPMDNEHWLGDLVFHRFFSSDDYDPRNVKVVLVEANKWNKWQRWLEKHKTKNTMTPVYVHPVEQVLISRKSFRIIKWVDEYRPFDFFVDPII